MKWRKSGSPRAGTPRFEAGGGQVSCSAGRISIGWGGASPRLRRTTLAEIHAALAEQAARRGAHVDCRQTNHEGLLVDWIGAAKDDGFEGILINAGAFTHTSYALHDSIKGCELPTIEVHISNPDARESFRHVSCIAAACKARVAGFGPASYGLALEGLLGLLGRGAGKAQAGGRRRRA
jgi:3-dehydroquinate dehydratase-2